MASFFGSLFSVLGCRFLLCGGCLLCGCACLDVLLNVLLHRIGHLVQTAAESLELCVQALFVRYAGLSVIVAELGCRNLDFGLDDSRLAVVNVLNARTQLVKSGGEVLQFIEKGFFFGDAAESAVDAVDFDYLIC